MKTTVDQGGLKPATGSAGLGERSQLVIGVLVAILGTAAAVSWWNTKTKTAALEASDSLYGAMKIVQAEEAKINPPVAQSKPDAAVAPLKTVDVDKEMAASVAALKGVWEKHPKSAAGNQARSELAALYLKNGQADKAVPLYEEASKHAAKGLDRTLAFYALGMAQDGAGQSDAAIKSLQSALENKKSGLEPEILLSLARLQKRAGKQDGVLAAVDRLKKEFPNSAQAKSAELLAQ